MVVVTATATKMTRVKIFDTLHLGPETVLIEKSPDRSNLKYSAIYITKSMPFEQIFANVITELKDKGKNSGRTIAKLESSVQYFSEHLLYSWGKSCSMATNNLRIELWKCIMQAPRQL